LFNGTESVERENTMTARSKTKMYDCPTTGFSFEIDEDPQVLKLYQRIDSLRECLDRVKECEQQAREQNTFNFYIKQLELAAAFAHNCLTYDDLVEGIRPCDSIPKNPS
jgi:hypothetical protein